MTTTTITSQIVVRQGVAVQLAGPSTKFWVASTVRELMAAHGLVGWKFDWDRAQRRYGCCHWSTKRISMSANLAPHRSRAENLNTMLHEIAHVLAGPAEGHGRKWQQIAQRIGAIPERCASSRPEEAAKPPLLLICTVCGATVAERFKRTDMWGKYHGKCPKAAHRPLVGLTLIWKARP
jgi:predicted SprT family Zn-dependent metalloprotease